jgi:hypothetical protein
MIAKSLCEHCGVNIEFATEEFLSGSSVNCPTCGKETTLNVSPQAKPAPKVESANESQPPPTLLTPDSNSSKNLRVCKDCGKTIGVHAESCPHCGATYKKKHGVFFYVFWGVVSLIATVVILCVAALFLLGIGLPAFVQGYQKARATASQRNYATVVSNATAVPLQSVDSESPFSPLSESERTTAKQLLASFDTSQDKVEGITWFQPKPTSENPLANRLYLYIGTRPNKAPLLRLALQSRGNRWIFAKGLTFRIDDQIERIELEYNQVKREHIDDAYFEFIDIPAKEHLEIIRRVIDSKETVLRIVGSEGQRDGNVRVGGKQKLNEALLVYRYLLEQVNATN